MHTAVDLAGPFSVVDPIKRCTTKKMWVAVFVCRATGAVDIAAVDLYHLINSINSILNEYFVSDVEQSNSIIQVAAERVTDSLQKAKK